jgi:hypothetical protein
MTSKVFALTLFCMIMTGVSHMAEAQPVDFSCPKVGTAVVGRNTDNNGGWETRYAGASKDDPYVCNRVSSNGKIYGRLFNCLPLDGDSNAEAARKALIALLSGSQNSVTFEFENVFRAQESETWTLLRHETLLVGGRSFDTLVFSRTVKLEHRMYPREGNFMLWLDPKNGVWLKSEFNLVAGPTQGWVGLNFEVLAVTLPP